MEGRRIKSLVPSMGVVVKYPLYSKANVSFRSLGVSLHYSSNLNGNIQLKSEGGEENSSTSVP